MTLTVPNEWIAPLTAAANLKGKTPEELALEGVRSVLPPEQPTDVKPSLLTLLGDVVGSIAGTGEAFSQDCGRRIAEGLAAGRVARP